MADAVTAVNVGETPNDIIYHLTSISDGTGESLVVKADRSTLVAANGAAPVSLDIISARWNIQGISSVRLLWGTTNPVVALVLSGSGYDDFEGKERDVTPGNCFLKDPRTATGERDILLTTNGALNGGTYDVTLVLRKQSA